ncbi:putative pantothenate transporter [Lindgomyces ingoldianus]|uniref:Pantothenate transporter n=1 Tax=Lindgomyces ingoldianus TaxID=673940 RepID=A0ACB6R5D7_9PLEO|nr:putative pantothenate transporter [Lindgomyces ingoldianus]KAF2474391.1 putative pantothenate transporter [Lindgomyces ingoldianus]
MGQPSPSLDRRVKLKIDFMILPLLSSVYFLAQMGRSDLANAKIAGMDDELNLSPKMYSNVSSIFLVGYITFQLPGTLLLRKIGPPLQFGLAMIAWGLITTCTVKVNSYSGLMVVRTFIGVAEALIQGAVFYLSFWYRYDELATRGAILYSTSALAGSFNGLIAYAIERTLDAKGGWSSWRWIFLIEGILPVAWAFVIISILPSTPETVRLGFKPEEKAAVIQRSRAAHNTGESKIRPKLILKLLLEPQFWMFTLIDCGSHFCDSSLSNFIPAILQGLGYSDVNSQLLAVVVYASAFVGILVACRISDKIKLRGIVISVCSAVAALGYVLLLSLRNNLGRLIATCMLAAGVYPITVLTLSWMAANIPGYTYRASAVAMINVISQCLSISGNQAYQDPPFYRKGMSASLGLICMSGVVAMLTVVYLKRMNQNKLTELDGEKAARLRELSIDEIGSKHPDFFFTY